MASSVREIEQYSASACSFEHTSMRISKNHDWIDHTTSSSSLDIDALQHNDDDEAQIITPCTSLLSGCTIRIAPMERRCGGWADEHFHDKLTLPSGSTKMRGVVVMLEAMARECVAVALSPEPYFVMGKTYVVHFGAAGNLNTVLRRRLPSGNEAVDVSFPSRVCTPSKWTPYWIVLQKGQLSAGIGRKVGHQCIGTLDDTMYDQLRPGMDAVHYVGLGNSALGQTARDLKVRNVRLMPMPTNLYGDTGIPMQPLQSDLAHEQDAHDAALLAQYEEQCAKAKARAIKFGIEYKQPPKPDAFLRYSEARRLRDNPEKGFITGIDTLSQQEQEKAKARKRRFEDDEQNQKMDADADHVLHQNTSEPTKTEPETNTQKIKQPLPIHQAWDNQHRVASQRIDPPPQLYPRPPHDDQPPPTQFHQQDPPTLIKQKIHIFALDWAAFKQIRSPDIMAHFADYGPSYVEWINELSCNVLFEDQYSAARALANTTMEIPSPPPPPVLPESQEDTQNEPPNEDQDTQQQQLDQQQNQQQMETESSQQDFIDYGAMGWRFGKFTLRKIANDQFGRRGTRSRILARVATSLDMLEQRPTERLRPPRGFTTRRVLGPGTEARAEKRDRNRRNKPSSSSRRNTKRRRRNNGGPGRNNDNYDEEMDEQYSDYDDYDDDDDHNYNDDNNEEHYQNDANNHDDHAMDEEHPKLNQELKSKRAGFSVEQMEKERAEKMLLQQQQQQN